MPHKRDDYTIWPFDDHNYYPSKDDKIDPWRSTLEKDGTIPDTHKEPKFKDRLSDFSTAELQNEIERRLNKDKRIAELERELKELKEGR